MALYIYNYYFKKSSNIPFTLGILLKSILFLSHKLHNS